MGQDEQETDAKNRTLTNSASKLTNPLEITIFGQDEQESDVKIRDITNSASQLTNRLEMVKK